MTSVILTPDQRLRVFVSSTMEELADERMAARRAVERLRLAPVMFELGARPHPPRSLYLAYLRQSHVFVGVYWQRYGWVAPGMEVSGLEDELLHASGMPRLVYLKVPAPDLDPELATMLRCIRAAADVSYKRFETPEELEDLLAADLALLLSERFLAEPSGPAPAEQAQRWTVPTPVSDFIGRRAEVDQLVQLFTQPEPRLVTLTGPGGVGKTRLALEAARRVAPGFADGVGFVALSPSATRLQAAIAAALRLPQMSAEPPEASLPAYLLDKTVLLILDNFESVIDQAAQVAELLAAVPRLRLLVTSRVALRLTGEQEVAVAPLTVPDPNADLPVVLGSEAVQLFARRAAAVRYGFGVDASNADAVAQICRRLDGLPLAIELVAARAGVMSLNELAGRLEDVLDLPARARDVPERQRTLRATLDWSFSQLDSVAQHAFARLGVFPASFTAPAAGTVISADATTDVLDLLAGLVDHSLLRPLIDSAETRFSMLQTVRDYARSQLSPAETRRALARHAAYYQVVAVEKGSALRGGGQRAALQALDADIANIELAVESLLADSQQEAVADVAWALWLYCWTRGALSVWRGWLRAASDDGGTIPIRARARLLGADGFLAVWQQDYDSALPELLEALKLGRQVQDDSLVTLVDVALVLVYGGTGDDIAARAAGQEALGLARAAGDRWSEAYALTGMCFLDVALGRFAGRADVFDAMVDAARSCEDPVCLAFALGNLGELRLDAGDGTAAAGFISDSLCMSDQLAMTYAGSFSLDSAAKLLSSLGHHTTAVRIEAAADAAMRRIQAAWWKPRVPRRERLLADARRRLGDVEYATAWDEGGLLSFHAGVDTATAALAAATRDDGGQVSSPTDAASQRDAFAPLPAERPCSAGQPDPRGASS
jgi:predicted ATPase